jgi:hypothetical protein
LATFALVIGLVQSLSPSVQSRVGLTLLGLWGARALIAMSFPIDRDGAPQTLAGTIHGINGQLTFLSATIGVFLLSWRFKQDDRWRPFHRTALILSLFLLAGFIGGFLSRALQLEIAGLMQRITLVVLVMWMLLTAAHLRAVAVAPARG